MKSSDTGSYLFVDFYNMIAVKILGFNFVKEKTGAEEKTEKD
jgi:hypothetical protein